jgi:hypothetical protein
MKKINDLICEIGGCLVILIILLFIALIWFDTVLILKMIGSCSILIVLMHLSDKATRE